MSSALPRVSVCLLTYKRAHVLPRTLDSLLAQSHSDFELIINDDCSPDDTAEVCRAYARRDRRIQYFRNPVNLRYAQNQNAAILRANHECVAIVHDGDVYRPDLIEKWTRALVEQPSAAIVFNALGELDDEGRTTRIHRHSYGPLVPGIELFDQMIRAPSSPIFGIVMVRKPCVLSVGPFDPRLPILADIDMWLRLLLKYDAAYIAEPLASVAGREIGHANTSTNWGIRGQHELIYLLNSARRYPGDPARVARLRRAISPMLWRVRLSTLLYCAARRHWKATSDGLAFIARHANLVAMTPPDTVLDWTLAARRVAGEQPAEDPTRQPSSVISA